MWRRLCNLNKTQRIAKGDPPKLDVHQIISVITIVRRQKKIQGKEMNIDNMERQAREVGQSMSGVMLELNVFSVTIAEGRQVQLHRE